MKGNAGKDPSLIWYVNHIENIFIRVDYVWEKRGSRKDAGASETRRWPGGGQAIGRQSAKSQNELKLNERNKPLCLGAGGVSPISWDQESREAARRGSWCSWKQKQTVPEFKPLDRLLHNKHHFSSPSPLPISVIQGFIVNGLNINAIHKLDC